MLWDANADGIVVATATEPRDTVVNITRKFMESCMH